MDFLDNLPSGSVLGVNYSGMHDSAIALVAPDGTPLFALSLERLSRVKQDGRPLHHLFDDIPWERIGKVAISAQKSLPRYKAEKSNLLSTLLPNPRRHETLSHGTGFYEVLSEIPCEKIFVGHQEAHAASAFWGSGFEESICLTYDGGMSNDLWFGGLYRCSIKDGIQPVEQFDALQYAKVTTLYTFVTALLGLMPMRHEGKVTGLAAYGKPTLRCNDLLTKWFEKDFFDLENALYWVNCYGQEAIPQLVPSDAKFRTFHAQSDGIGKEELAASIQNFAERHVLQILNKARSLGWVSRNICLAGGLFSNVKINQRVAESGFGQLFVAPAMTDDGTALGAAWCVASGSKQFKPRPLNTIFLGPKYPESIAHASIRKNEITFQPLTSPEKTIAELLSQKNVVAVFRGAAEFGPRSLGNRSILASAENKDINQSLNDRLSRTEFMPFAPMTRDEDASLCYHEIARVRHAAQFMTVTVDCTDRMQKMCPAVVHVDGTARPQLVTMQNNPFMHAVLTEYKKMTGRLAIVNTSFNVHEEPIVCSPEDALRGFFESGLDHLYLEGVGLISYQENQLVAIKYLKEKIKRKSHKDVLTASLIKSLDASLAERTEWLEKTGKDLQERTEELLETRQTLAGRTQELMETRQTLVERTEELVETRQTLVERTQELVETRQTLVERTQELVETRQNIASRLS